MVENEAKNDDPEVVEVPEILHWWTYIERTFTESLFSVEFVQEQNATEDGELLTTGEMGLRWLIIALYKTHDLETVVRKLLCRQDFLKLYKPQEGLLLLRKNQMLEAMLCLKKKDLRFRCDILDKFVTRIRQKDPRPPSQGAPI